MIAVYAFSMLFLQKQGPRMTVEVGIAVVLMVLMIFLPFISELMLAGGLLFQHPEICI